MDICVVGCGYVGLTTGTVLAKSGHQVTCVDINVEKVDQLSMGRCPFFEAGLEELMQQQIEKGALGFSTRIRDCMRENDVILIAVGTPSLENGRTDLTYILEVTDDLAAIIETPKTIIIKSTVPPGTNEMMRKRLISAGINKSNFTILSNPEFLREGNALYDLYHPDKIVVGGDHPDQLEFIRNLFDHVPSTYFFTTPVCAELIKYASNAFLATKISFINELARICDTFGADVKILADAIGTDPRIGPDFLKPGIGYGGYCLPKDIRSLCHSAERNNVNVPLLHGVEETNNSQIDLYIEKIEQQLGSLRDSKITVWGLTFKANTDDLRDSPSIRLINRLSEKGATVTGYDPMAKPSSSQYTYCKNLYDSVDGADIVFIATDWDEFSKTDWNEVKKRMNGHTIVDGRNCLDPEAIRSTGISYITLGG